MKASVAVVATLAASAQAQFPFYPYAGYAPGYAGVPVAASAPVATYATGAPVIAPAAPLIAAHVPAPAFSNQFQSQDEFKNTAHGYANINSAKHEQGNALLGVTGSYSYVDANGVLQTTNYIADGLGFRVQATNLPVAPAAPEVAPLEAPVFDLKAPVFDLKAPVFEGKAPVFNLVGPAPVEDTEEVKAAKAEFQAKFDEAASREKRSTPAATEPLKVVAPAPYPVAPFAPYAAGPFGYAGAYAPNAYAGAYAPHAVAGAYAPYAYAPAAPVAYTTAPVAPVPAAVVPSIPAAREAILTKVKLNPGHAVAYRVD